MELTGLQIFKYLPGAKKTEGTNCKKCGCPTCMAFALKLAKKQVDINLCPHVPVELFEKFSESSKIQQHELELGLGIKIGGENVMFRHDKTFVNRTVIAIEIDVEAPDIEETVDNIINYEIERIGEKFKVDAVFFQGELNQDLKNRLEIAGIIPIANDDLRIVRGNDIYELEAQSKNVINSGQDEIILNLASENKTVQKLVEELTYIRRAAIIRKHEPFTWPVMVNIPGSLSVFEASAFASLLICRYANIVVLNEFNEALLATLFTLRQNIYTNPQKPLQVEAKIYEFNTPQKNAPVFLTTNFALTYFAVAGELESLPVGTYLVVTPADGMSVLTAWSADKFTAEMVAKSINKFQLAEKVDTREIIIPGLLSHMKDELQEVLPDWNIVIGTIEACEIPEFVRMKLAREKSL